MRFGVVVEMGIPRAREFFKLSVVNTRQESGRKLMDFGVEAVCIDCLARTLIFFFGFRSTEIWTPIIKPVGPKG